MDALQQTSILVDQKCAVFGEIHMLRAEIVELSCFVGTYESWGVDSEQGGAFDDIKVNGARRISLGVCASACLFFSSILRTSY